MDGRILCLGRGCCLRSGCANYSGVLLTRASGVIDSCDDETRPGYVTKR